MADYFAPFNEVAESAADEDLGSGGVMLLPDVTDSGGVVRHLMVGAGKDGNLYVINRDSMGKFSSSSNADWQELDGALWRRRLSPRQPISTERSTTAVSAGP